MRNHSMCSTARCAFTNAHAPGNSQSTSVRLGGSIAPPFRWPVLHARRPLQLDPYVSRTVLFDRVAADRSVLAYRLAMHRALLGETLAILLLGDAVHPVNPLVAALNEIQQVTQGD